jgi:hypothetical protein
MGRLVDTSLAFGGGWMLFAPDHSVLYRVLGGLYVYGSTVQFPGWRS